MATQVPLQAATLRLFAQRHWKCLSDSARAVSSCAKLSDYHGCSLLLKNRQNFYSVCSHRPISTSQKLLGKEKLLFTPGPLMVTKTVKETMLTDFGSRDTEFIQCTKFIRQSLLNIAGVSAEDYTAIPLQGSGTFAVDATFQTLMPKEGGRVLILENGAYGKRMAKICEAAGIEHNVQSFREDKAVEVEVVQDALSGRIEYDMVAVVHCETSSGVINPVEDIGKIIKEHNKGIKYFVDAMSSFAAIPVDFEKGKIDAIVSSANKCIQGVPGFAYVIVRQDVINECEGNSRSLALDLYDQVKYLDKTLQFRFAPPTHAMVAFKQALIEFEAEGGVKGRGERYAKNRDVLKKGMDEMGFKELLDENAGYIITSYYYPSDPNFNFTEFYNRLNEKDFVIYPGKILDADCFRIGTIGNLHEKDMTALLNGIREVCNDMKIKLPLQ